MGKHGNLLRLRLALDREITYGSHRRALALAREGLRQAGVKRFAAEQEYFKGQLDLLRGRFSCALEHFDEALRYNPRDGAAYNDRALCMVELGSLDAALAYFDKGIRAEPDFATIHHNKGWLLNNLGVYRQAIRCLKKALALEPGRAVTYDNLADAYYNLGDYRRSLEAYQKVLDLLPPGKCRGIRGQIMLKMKEIAVNQRKGR